MRPASQIVGSGWGSVSTQEILAVFSALGLAEKIAVGTLDVDARAMPLTDLEQAWTAADARHHGPHPQLQLMVIPVSRSMMVIGKSLRGRVSRPPMNYHQSSGLAGGLSSQHKTDTSPVPGGVQHT